LFFVPVVLMPVAQEETLQVTFTSLCQQWKRDTGRLSVLVKKVMHRAYQQIIGLGAPALPLILKELARADDHWFWALEAISRENPARDCTTFEDAANAWLRWGAERGFIQD
jgi:hypothetical protein